MSAVLRHVSIGLSFPEDRLRLVAFSLLALAGLVSPTLAADPPTGSYYCHDQGNTPLGLFSITGPGTYEWQSVATVDFKNFKEDRSNGPGTYTTDANGVMNFTGNFADAWQVQAQWDGTWFWFANDYGGVMRCGTALSG